MKVFIRTLYLESWGKPVFQADEVVRTSILFPHLAPTLGAEALPQAWQPKYRGPGHLAPSYSKYTDSMSRKGSQKDQRLPPPLLHKHCP